MVNAKDACRIFERLHPTLRIIRCLETSEYFFFESEPRRWNGEGSGAGGGEMCYVVKNNGEAGSMNIIYMPDEEYKDVDVMDYLSEEDRVFAQKILDRRK